MQYTRLGNTELTISRICMGCMGFGDARTGQHSWTLNETDSRAVIQRGLEPGVNFFDTAIGYQGGSSERYLGRALNELARRDEVVIATKFLPRPPETIAAGVSRQQHIENQLNTSLKNLDTDYVDLYIYHMWDFHTPIHDVLDGLNRAVQAGKVRYLGISNCFAWQLAEANALAEKENLAPFVSMQGHYNLIYREEERETIPYCQSRNIALTPYSALAGGRLSRRPNETSRRLEEDKYARLKYDATAEQDSVIIARVAELAAQRGTSMTEIALAWLLAKVSAPVVGATRFSHVEGAAKAVDISLTPEETAFLEAPYVPHNLSGVLAQNKADMKEKPVWQNT